MREIAAIEISVLVRELNDRFSSSYFKSFYEISKNSFLILFSKERKDIAMYINLTKAINETEFREKAEAPSEFALEMRKKLDGCRIGEIRQHKRDRIVIINLTGREEKKLVIEMFDKGNMLLLNKEGIIEIAYMNKSFRNRSIRKGMIYSFPESKAKNFEAKGEGEVKFELREMKGSEQKLIVALSHVFNLGPAYLENAIFRAGLDANAPAKSQEIEKSGIAKEMANLLSAIDRPKPIVYKKDEICIDFAIVPLAKYETDKKVHPLKFETLNKLLDSIYRSERTMKVDMDKVREIDELKASIEKQMAQIEELKAKAEDYKRIATKIFEHMNEINALLDEARKRKAKDVAGIGSQFGNINVKGVDPKRKSIRIEMN
jgi:predicted ribosome quality control (RQC) complex YloA/Tae2 family protein